MTAQVSSELPLRRVVVYRQPGRNRVRIISKRDSKESKQVLARQTLHAIRCNTPLDRGNKIRAASDMQQ